MLRDLASAFVVLPLLAAPALADADAAGGEAIYAENCATCHGEALRNPGASFDLRALKASERAHFETSVLNGKGQMPPWRGALTPADIDALWAYVRANAAD